MQARTEPTRVVKELSPEVMDAFKDARLLALDVEGVDLSREGACLFSLDLILCARPETGCAGQCSLVQLAVLVDGEKSLCFLFDVLNKSKDDPMIGFLREILESDSVLKIIHDCRMDADAMHHLLDIKLANVHDTSAWHYKLTGNQDLNLNDMLQSNGLKPNVVRDGDIYRTNHAFLATRPLTEKIITWAAGDVNLMFNVHALQVDKATPAVARGGDRALRRASGHGAIRRAWAVQGQGQHREIHRIQGLQPARTPAVHEHPDLPARASRRFAVHGVLQGRGLFQEGQGSRW